MTIKEQIYFDLKYKNRLDAIIRSEEKLELKKRYPVTKNYIKNAITNDYNLDYEECKKSFEDKYSNYVIYYNNYYSDERAHFFLNPDELMKWFDEQNDSCGYCKVTYTDLQKIVNHRGGNLTLNKKKKRSKGSLEIERLEPSIEGTLYHGYTYGNCILACPLCNNAKSNLIDDASWRTLFVPAMKLYYKKLLDGSEEIRIQDS